MRPTFITLTGIPQQLSVIVSETTNSKAQWEMKIAEGKIKLGGVLSPY